MTKRARAGLRQPFKPAEGSRDVLGALRQHSEANPHARIKAVLDELDTLLSARLAALGAASDPEGEAGFLKAALRRVSSERRALAVYGKGDDWTWANGFMGGFALAQLVDDWHTEIELGPDIAAGTNARRANRKRAIDRIGGDRAMMETTRAEVLAFAVSLRAKEPTLKNWPLAGRIKDHFHSRVPTEQQLARAWIAEWVQSGELAAAL